MVIRFGDWLPFNEAYSQSPDAGRGSMFQPKARELSDTGVGVYLVGDHWQGGLASPASVIYLGMSVGVRMPSRFHDRLWKRCCKAIGECGGRFTELAGEPRDTARWAAYRRTFKGFDGWHFAFARLNAPDIRAARCVAQEAERAAMGEFVRRHGSMPVCNGSPLRQPRQLSQVVFPWDR
jgi:hypothetical protein